MIKIKTAIYIRVSTEEQAAEGYSIDAQKTKLVQYCQIHDLDIGGIYIDDGVSAKDLNRPQVQKLLKTVEDRTIQRVLVFKLDRITRSLRDLLDLIDLFEAKKVIFTSLTEQIDTSTATGRMFVQLLGVIAEWERGIIGERVVEGMEERARTGKYTAPGSPYGYTYDGENYLINEEEAQVIRLIFEMHRGGKGYTKIANYLNELGYRTKRGALHTTKSVNLIITRPYYCGWFNYKPKGKKPFLVKATNIPEPIITEEEFKMSRKIAESRRSDSAKKHSRDEFILHNKLRCSCGRLMRTTISIRYGKRIKEKPYLYYSCFNKLNRRCTQGNISIEKVDAEFLEFLKNLENKKETIDVEKDKSRIEALNKEKENANNQLERENERKKRLQFLYIDDKIDQASYLDLMSDIDLSVKRLIGTIKAMEVEIEKLSKFDLLEKEKKIASKLVKNWDLLDTKAKKEFVQVFIDQVILHEDKIKRVEFII